MDASLQDRARMMARLAALAGGSVTALGLWEIHRRLLESDEERTRHIEVYRRGWATLFLRALDVEVQADAPPAPKRPARLVVSNHRSILDIPVLLRHFGGRMLSKADVAEWPLAGAMARHAGTIFVDREDKRSGAVAIRAMRNALREGSTLTVFPEGTVHGGDEVRPFLPGAFTAASGLDVEIVPVALAYPETHEWSGVDTRTHLERLMRAPRSRVGLAVGEGFTASGSARELAEIARDSVQSLVARARARVR